MLVGRCKNIIRSQCSHHRPDFDSFRGQQCHSMNAHELQHESVIVDIYTQIKPDSFKLQTRSCKQPWQPTSIMRTSRGFRVPAVAPSPRSSSASSRTKRIPNVLRRRQDADTADAAGAAATPATPAIPPTGGTAAASCGEEPPPAHSPGGKSRGNKGRAGGGGKKASKA